MLRGLLVFLLIALLVIAFVFAQIVTTPPATAPAVYSPDAVVRFDQKLAAVSAQVEKSRALGRNDKLPVRLFVSEEEISAKAPQLVNRRGRLSQLAVKLAENSLTVTAVAGLAGMPIPLQAKAQIAAAPSGRVAVKVVGLSAGNVPVPGFLHQPIISGVTGLAQYGTVDLGVEITSAKITHGQIQIEGRTR